MTAERHLYLMSLDLALAVHTALNETAETLGLADSDRWSLLVAAADALDSVFGSDELAEKDFQGKAA